MIDILQGQDSKSWWFRSAAWVSFLVVVSAFGPYLLRPFGLRTDHIVVYSLFVGAGAFVLVGRAAVLKRPVWQLLWLWSGAAAFMTIVSILFGEAPSFTAVLASLETQTQPIALLVVFGLLLRKLTVDEGRRLVRMVSYVVIVLMCANAALAIASIYTDTSSVISYFVTTNAEGSSVSSRAMTMGRYSGVFNQPGEAGIAYSIAVLAWVYLVVAWGTGRVWLRVSLALLLIGGLLSVSKVFVLGGLPLALVYGLWEASKGRPSRAARLLLWGGVSIGAMGSLGGWAGWDYLMRLLPRQGMNPDELLRMYTAGRYGQAGMSAQGLVERTLQEAPLRGFGLASYAPLDSGYTEFLYQGGLVALFLYVAVLIVLLRHAAKSASLGIHEGRFQVMIWLLIIGGNLGAPVLTVNRASTVVWVVLLALMHTSWQVDDEPRPTSGGRDFETAARWAQGSSCGLQAANQKGGGVQ